MNTLINSTKPDIQVAENSLVSDQQLTKAVDRLGIYAKFADVLKNLIVSFFLIVAIIVGCFYLLPETLRSMKKAQLKSVDIAGLSFEILDKSISELGNANITVSGRSIVLDKGSPELLSEVRMKLRLDSSSTIDALRIVNGKMYDPKAVKEYITSLGIKFILFENPTRSKGYFDGWIDAGLFVAQLPPGGFYDYNDLRSTVVGIKHMNVMTGTKASTVLKIMETNHIDNVAVLDNQGNFKFMANRGELLSKVVSVALLNAKE